MAERDLRRVQLFRGLEPQQLSLIARLASQQSFRAGDTVFTQGQPATHLYLLLRGKVAIRFKPEDGEALPVAQLESGGVFGWSAALGHGQYTSGAFCTSDCETLVIAGDALRRLCETHPETGVLVLERLAEVIAQRLESTHDQVLELLHQGMKR